MRPHASRDFKKQLSNPDSDRLFVRQERERERETTSKEAAKSVDVFEEAKIRLKPVVPKGNR